MNLFTIILILLLLDILWLNTNNQMYNTLVKNVQHSNLDVGTLVLYTLMIIGFVFIVVPLLKNSKETKVIRALRYGALFGFVSYGIFNATNIAIFKNYSTKTAIIDTLWGTFIYFLISYMV